MMSIMMIKIRPVYIYVERERERQRERRRASAREEREPRGPCGLGGTCVRGDTEVDELPIVEVVVLDQGRHSASTTGVWWT